MNDDNLEYRLENPRRKQRIHLHVQAQQMCLNVYNNLKEKYGYENKDLIELTAQLTEVPHETIRKLVRTGIHVRKKRFDVGIRKTLSSLLAKNLKTEEEIIEETYEEGIIEEINVEGIKNEHIEEGIKDENIEEIKVKYINGEIKYENIKEEIIEDQ